MIWVPFPTGLFYIQSTWKAIRQQGVKVPWASVVWFPGEVPKWAFLSVGFAVWEGLQPRTDEEVGE